MIGRIAISAKSRFRVPGFVFGNVYAWRFRETTSTSWVVKSINWIAFVTTMIGTRDFRHLNAASVV